MNTKHFLKSSVLGGSALAVAPGSFQMTQQKVISQHKFNLKYVPREIYYSYIFQRLYNKGYDGVLGMEYGNSQKGKKGEKAVIEAYVQADDFA